MIYNDMLHRSFKLSDFEYKGPDLAEVLTSNFKANKWNKKDSTMAYKAPYTMEVITASDYFTANNPNHLFLKQEFPEVECKNHNRVDAGKFDDFDAEAYSENFSNFIINYVKFTKMPVKIDYYKPVPDGGFRESKIVFALKFTSKEISENESEAQKQLKETTLAFVQYGQKHHDDFINAREKVLESVPA